MAAIETRLVLRSIWDEIFPFEGVGFVHIKLQFVLNEEERNRIQIMVLFLHFISFNFNPIIPFNQLHF